MLLAIAIATVGCRRQHATATYESDNVPMAHPAPPAATPPGSPSTTASGAEAAPAPPPVASATRAKLPDGGTVNGDPRGPRPAEFNRVVDAAMPGLQACLDHAELPPGKYDVTIHYIVEHPGYTGGVTASGANVPKAALDCCASVVAGLKFPQYYGDKVERDLPFTYAKTLNAPDGGAAKR